MENTLTLLVVAIGSAFLGAIFTYTRMDKKETHPHVGEIHVIYDPERPDRYIYLQLDTQSIDDLMAYDRRQVLVTVHTNARKASANMNQ